MSLTLGIPYTIFLTVGPVKYIRRRLTLYVPYSNIVLWATSVDWFAVKRRRRDQRAPWKAHLMRSFLTRQIAGCTPATIEAYRSQLRPLCRWAHEHAVALDTLGEEHVREFLLFRQQVSQTTLHAATIRLKTFFKWCAQESLCDDLTARIRKPKQQVKIVTALSVEELRLMLLLCNGTTFVPKRNEALIRFLLDTAARVSEALSVTLERLEMEAGRVLLDGKGQKQRFAFFGSRTADALLRYVTLREKLYLRSSVLFFNRDGSPMNRRHALRIVARLGRRANISGKRCSPHTIRHSSALLFLQRGGDALSLQRLLGHTTLQMTRRYVNSRIDDLEAAHRRASPGDAV